MAQQQALILSVNSMAAKSGATQATRALDQVKKSADRATAGIERLEQASKKMRAVGKAMTIGLSLPIAAVGAAATKMASDAEEAANKFDVVMGPSAARLREEFKKLHATIPLTSHEMEGLSASVQDMLVPMGIVRERAADMSLEFVKLAGDLGSFNNVPTAQALNAIQAALAGQSESMRRFGVDTREAALESVALANGLIKAGEEMDAATRGQAVLLAITKDSTDAMGDAARTADSAANQFKFLMRNLKELSVTIGRRLLPVVTPMVQKLNEMLKTADGLSSSTLQWSIALGAVLAAAGPLLLVIGSLTTAVASLATAGASMVAVFAVGAPLLIGLGVLSALWVKNKLGAAEFAGELDQIKRNAREAATKVNDLSAAQTLNILAGRRMALVMLEEANRAILEEQRAGLARSGVPGTADMTAARLARTLGGEQLEAFRNNQRAIESTTGVIETLEAQWISLANNTKTATDEATSSVNNLASEWVAAFGRMDGPTSQLDDMGIGGSGSTFTRYTQNAKETKKAVRELVEPLNDVEMSVRSLSFAFENALVGAITGSKDAMQDFVAFAIRELARLAIKFAIFKGLTAVASGGSSLAADLLKITGLDFGGVDGALAHGGPARAGGTYLVGEQGPELFTPQQSGYVHPNGAGVSLDFSNFPAPSNPLAMARDAEWQRFLRESLRDAEASGFAVGAT